MTICEAFCCGWIIWKLCPCFLIIIEVAREMKADYYSGGRP